MQTLMNWASAHPIQVADFVINDKIVWGGITSVDLPENILKLGVVTETQIVEGTVIVSVSTAQGFTAEELLAKLTA